MTNKQKTIADAPEMLNTNDKAMWVIGWNECLAAHEQARVVGEPVAWREALQFYADPGDYKAPFTAGMGKLWHDCGEAARKALAAPVAQPATEQAEAPSDFYIQTAIRALYENSDPVSVDAAELLQKLAAQPTASNAGERDDLHNFTTHRASWRKAIETLAKQDDSGYWQHELKAYDDAMVSFDRAALASKPVAPPAREALESDVIRYNLADELRRFSIWSKSAADCTAPLDHKDVDGPRVLMPQGRDELRQLSALAEEWRSRLLSATTPAPAGQTTRYAGNQCGCNHWTKPVCPEKGCPWNAHRAARGDEVNQK